METNQTMCGLCCLASLPEHRFLRSIRVVTCRCFMSCYGQMMFPYVHEGITVGSSVHLLMGIWVSTLGIVNHAAMDVHGRVFV